MQDKVSQEIPPALRDEVARMVATTSAGQAGGSSRDPPQQQPAAEASNLPAGSFIRNRASGVIHKLTLQGDGLAADWTTTCGWRFASSLNAEVCCDVTGLPHKLLCEKCLPDLRAAKKEAFEDFAREQARGHDGGLSF